MRLVDLSLMAVIWIDYGVLLFDMHLWVWVEMQVQIGLYTAGRLLV